MKLSKFELDLLEVSILQSIESQEAALNNVPPSEVKDRLKVNLDKAVKARRDLLKKIKQNVTVE